VIAVEKGFGSAARYKRVLGEATSELGLGATPQMFQTLAGYMQLRLQREDRLTGVAITRWYKKLKNFRLTDDCPDCAFRLQTFMQFLGTRIHAGQQGELQDFLQDELAYWGDHPCDNQFLTLRCLKERHFAGKMNQENPADRFSALVMLSMAGVMLSLVEIRYIILVQIVVRYIISSLAILVYRTRPIYHCLYVGNFDIFRRRLG